MIIKINNNYHLLDHTTERLSMWKMICLISDWLLRICGVTPTQNLYMNQGGVSLILEAILRQQMDRGLRFSSTSSTFLCSKTWTNIKKQIRMLLGIEIFIKQIILFLKNPKIETIQYSMILVPSLSYISSPNKHNDQPGLSIDMKLSL